MNTETQISSKETYIRRHIYVLWYEKNIWYDHSKATCFWCLRFSYVREVEKSPSLRFFCEEYIYLIFLNYKVGQQQEGAPQSVLLGNVNICTYATIKFCIFEHYDMNMLGENYVNCLYNM